jgi:hypothetical protein
MDEISSGNLRSPTIVRLVGESRTLNALPLGIPMSSWVAKSLGPQIPKFHENIWTVDLFHAQGVVEECMGRNHYEPSDLG